MHSPTRFAQTKSLRFTDPVIEAAYREDRNEREAPRAVLVQLALALLVGLLGAMVIGVNLRQHLDSPRAWLVLRFGVIVPAMLVSALLCSRPWGQARLQLLLGCAVTIAVGAYTLEWFLEWTPAMPLRSLWVVPITMLWVIALTLCLDVKSTIGTTLGVLVIAQAGIAALIAPRYGAPVVITTALAYLLCGGGLVLITRWREHDSRELFAHQHEHERLLTELRTQYEALQALIDQRNEFVAGVLHDLRSPLTAVLLGVEMLRTGEHLAPATRAALLEDITRSAKRVGSFANRFLEQRLPERASDKSTLIQVLLGPAVERAVAHAQLTAAHKNQSIRLTIVAADQVVSADELLLDRAILNLLDNAVKYSPLGASIAVRVDLEPGPAARAIIAVTDSGPGLTAAEQARLFQPYSVLGKIPTGGESSTGLGLSLVKHYMEAMGGEVGCDSESGHGATFWLALRRGARAV